MKKILAIAVAFGLSLFFGSVVEAATGLNMLAVAAPVFAVSVFVPAPANALGLFIGNLTASASGLFTQPNTPEYIGIGTVDTDSPLTALSITVRGRARINITAQARIQAFCKWMMGGALGADVKVGTLIKVAETAIPKEDISFNYTNGAAGTEAVYFFSTAKKPAKDAKLYEAAEQTIQASSSMMFTNFDALIFVGTNIDYCNVTFRREGAQNWTEKMSVAELNMLFLTTNAVSDADGRLAAQTVIDNKLGNIVSVEINTTSGGSVTVLRVNI